MFGSTTPFGQSSNSPFGSTLVFGQNSNASSNQFAPKPFAGTTPFGSPTGESIFYGTSTGVFGANSSPAGSTSTFHAPSYSAFGSSAPAFGSSSSSFGGSSIFGQKPVFGGFVSNPNQSNSFGISFQQTQTTFQSNLFGSSTSFGASTQNAPGAARSPAFGAPISSHNSVAAFGFGTGGGALGSGAANTLEASNTSIFGVSKDSSIGASSSPTFGTSSTTRFDVGTTPTFGQSTSASGSSSFFGTAPSAFGAQNLSFGFGQLAFSGRHGGSRVAAYTATAEVDDNSSTQLAAKLQSISAMTINKDKSHEELRWEDYQSGDKGGLCCMGQSAGGIGFGGSTVQSSSFGPSPTLFHSTVNPFYPSTASNSFAPQTSANPFQPQTSSTPSGPQSTMPTFGITGFGQSAFSSQCGRSRVAAYIATAEVDGTSSTQHAAKLQSISAMPINKDKNHEELRWKDYQSGDKGGPHRMSQSAVGIGNGGSTIHSNHICPPALTQSSINPFYSLTTSNPFTHQTSSIPFAPKTSSTPFTPQTSSNPFAPTVPEFSSLFFNKPSANSFGTSSSSAPSPFVIVPAPAPGFRPLPSIFSSTSALGTASGFNSGSSSANTQLSPKFQSVAPLAQRSSSGQSVANSLSQPNNFSAPSTESQLGGNFSQVHYLRAL